MEKKYIVFYISSHGYGHLTRTLALIEYIFEETPFDVYLCSGQKQVHFAKIYLEKYKTRIVYQTKEIDVGVITFPNSMEIDVVKTQKEVEKLLNQYPLMLKEELETLSNYKVEFIISDISAFGILVGEQLSCTTIGIANFTWVDQYISIGMEKRVIEQLCQIYKKGSYYIRYDLSLPFRGADEKKRFSSNYLISRKVSEDRKNSIKKELTLYYEKQTGKDMVPNILYLSLGKSVELKPIKVHHFEGVIVYTEGVLLDQDTISNNTIVTVKLPLDILDTQNYIAASDIAIAKAGWSSTAESLIAHTKLALILREGVDDDMNTIQSLQARKLAVAITETQLADLDYQWLCSMVEQGIEEEKLKKITNDVEKLWNTIVEHL